MKVRIETIGSIQRRVWLDGVQAKNLTAIEVAFPLGEPATLKLTGFSTDIEIEGEMEVTRVRICAFCKAQQLTDCREGIQERQKQIEELQRQQAHLQAAIDRPDSV